MDVYEKKGKKILLVDDDIEIRQMYAEIFSIAGFETSEANDGAEGFEMASKTIPDLIFTGINMPNMDGFALIGKLKERPETAKIPVVISSHMGREEHRLKAEEVGAKDFIVKNNVTPRETVERIKAIFSGGKEYRILIDAEALDAPELLKVIGAEKVQKCPSCESKLAFQVSIADYDKKSLLSGLGCSRCEWKLK